MKLMLATDVDVSEYEMSEFEMSGAEQKKKGILIAS